jgi:4-amino-4-deoxy-L-arabinose transferase-like glycosyltransferase
MGPIKRKLKDLKELGPKRFYQDNQIFLIILAIFIIAFVLRIWNLDAIPGGFSEAERQTVDTIRNLKFGNLWLKDGFFNAAYIYTAFIWTKLLGLTVYNLRLLSAVVGGVTIVMGYIFISEWFSRKIAIFTALLFATSAFHISVSRLIIPEIFLPLVLLSLFVVLTKAYRTKNVWLFGLSGALMGVGLYTSAAFLLVLPLFAIAGFYFYRKNEKFITSYKIETLTALAAFSALAIPYLVSFINQKENYLDYYGFGNSALNIAMNFSQIFTSFFVRTPTNYFVNVWAEPLMDPLIFVTYVFGFLFAIISVSRRKYFFLIAWLAFFWLYAALKRDVLPADFLGLIPVIYTFSALIIDYVLDRWFETFPLNKKIQVLSIGLISIFFALSMLYNFNKYFVAYKNSSLVHQEFSAESVIPLK